MVDTCPSEQDLAAFLVGDVPDAKGAVIAAHMAGCPACNAEASRIEKLTTPLLAALRDLGLQAGAGSSEPDADPSLTTKPGRSDGSASPGVGTESSVAVPTGYELLGRVGGGGMGEVYRVRHRRLDRVVALKMIRCQSPEVVLRFRFEAQAVARLQHPNIVQIYEVGDFDGRPFLTLEYVPGGSLDHHLAGTPVSPTQAAELLRALARAVHHAHERGIIHRDLKPANILMADEGDGPVPKVADFGIARLADVDSGVTRDGDILGTPSYMAPEQADGRVERIGPATDVYSLGVLLYEMMTGRVPFRGVDAVQTLLMVRTQDPVAPRKFNARLPRDLETICLKCLAKDPAHRYATAAELGDDLGRWLEGKAIRARPVGAATRIGLWTRRNPAAAALVATVAFALMAGLATAVVVERRARSAAERSLARETARFALAAEAVGTFHSQISQDLLLKQKGFAQTRAALLGQARDFYARLGDLLDRQEDRGSRGELATAFQKLGDLELEIGRKPEAEAAYRRGLAICEAIARVPGAGVEAEADVARLLMKLGQVHRYRDLNRDAVAYGQRARHMLEPLVRDHPEIARLRYDLADTLNDLGAFAYSLEDLPASQSYIDRSLRLREELVAEHPDDAEYRNKLSHGYYNRSVLATSLKQPSGDLLSKAEEQRRILLKSNPEKIEWLADLGRILLSRSNLAIEQGDRAEGYRYYEQTRDLLESVIRKVPEIETARMDLGNALEQLGTHLILDRRYDEAIRTLDRAVEVLDSIDDRNGFATNLISIAILRGAEAEWRLGHEDASQERYARARVRGETKIRAKNESRNQIRAAIEGQALGVYLAWKLGKATPRQAVDAIDAALGRVAPHAAKNPFWFTFQARYHTLRAALAGVAGSGRSIEQGQADLDDAVALLRRTQGTAPGFAWMFADPSFGPLRTDPGWPLRKCDLLMPLDPFAAPR